MTRIALITGGTRGLGLAIGHGLATAGRLPILVYLRDRASAEAAHASLLPLHPGVRILQLDVGDELAVGAAIAKIKEEIGPIEILINSAFRSGRSPKKVHELEPSAWREDLATNLDGPFLVTRAVLPHMVERNFGRIVFIGSFAARGEMGRVAYSTAKAALAGLSGTIAQEYARHGITSNVVSPGFIDAGAFNRLAPEIKERAVKRVPAQRAGTAEEIAGLVTHLAADASGYLTGQVIGVDGGAR
jgi:NAD(P)-dependent dehydrogenase (short-subunit alcohol dehydrogenase family)